MYQKSQTHLLLGHSYVIRRQPVPLCRQQNDFLENPVAWGSHQSMEDAGSAESSAWLGMVQGNHSVFHVPRVSLKLSVGSCWCMQERCAFGWTAKSNIHLVLSFPGLSPGKLLQKKNSPKGQIQLMLGQSFAIGSARKQHDRKLFGLRQLSKHGGRCVDLALQKAQFDWACSRRPTGVSCCRG